MPYPPIYPPPTPSIPQPKRMSRKLENGKANIEREIINLEAKVKCLKKLLRGWRGDKTTKMVKNFESTNETFPMHQLWTNNRSSSRNT